MRLFHYNGNCSLIWFNCEILVFLASLPPVAGSYSFMLVVLFCILMSYATWLYMLHDGRLIRGGNCLPFASTWVHPNRFLIVSVMLNFLVFCFVLCIFALSAYILICSQWITILDSPGFYFFQRWSYVQFSVLCCVCFFVFVLCIVYVCLSVYCVLCMFLCLRTVYYVCLFVLVLCIVYVCLSSYCVLYMFVCFGTVYCVCLFVFVLCIVYVCLSSYCVLCMFVCLRTV